jgi:hypothetical protein
MLVNNSQFSLFRATSWYHVISPSSSPLSRERLLLILFFRAQQASCSAGWHTFLTCLHEGPVVLPHSLTCRDAARGLSSDVADTFLVVRLAAPGSRIHALGSLSTFSLQLSPGAAALCPFSWNSHLFEGRTSKVSLYLKLAPFISS